MWNRFLTSESVPLRQELHTSDDITAPNHVRAPWTSQMDAPEENSLGPTFYSPSRRLRSPASVLRRSGEGVVSRGETRTEDIVLGVIHDLEQSISDLHELKRKHLNRTAQFDVDQEAALLDAMLRQSSIGKRPVFSDLGGTSPLPLSPSLDPHLPLPTYSAPASGMTQFATEKIAPVMVNEATQTPRISIKLTEPSKPSRAASLRSLSPHYSPRSLFRDLADVSPFTPQSLIREQSTTTTTHGNLPQTQRDVIADTDNDDDDDDVLAATPPSFSPLFAPTSAVRHEFTATPLVTPAPSTRMDLETPVSGILEVPDDQVASETRPYRRSQSRTATRPPSPVPQPSFDPDRGAAESSPVLLSTADFASPLRVPERSQSYVIRADGIFSLALESASDSLLDGSVTAASAQPQRESLSEVAPSHTTTATSVSVPVTVSILAPAASVALSSVESALTNIDDTHPAQAPSGADDSIEVGVEDLSMLDFNANEPAEASPQRHQQQHLQSDERPSLDAIDEPQRHSVIRAGKRTAKLMDDDRSRTRRHVTNVSAKASHLPPVDESFAACFKWTNDWPEYPLMRQLVSQSRIT